MFGNRYEDYTYSTNLQRGIMFWLDEGLVEQGFWFSSTIPSYAGDRDLSILVPTTIEGQYDFSHKALVWQTGVTTSFGVASKPSGIYIDGDFSVNDDSVYHIDYHNGRVNFTTAGWASVVRTYGADPTITADYHAKTFKVFYDTNNSVKAYLSYISDRWLSSTIIEEKEYKFPIIVSNFRNQRVKPYEMGGTRYLDMNYNIFVATDSKEQRDEVADILIKQEDIKIPSRVWKDMYNTDGQILYSSTSGYIGDCTAWKPVWINKIEEKRFQQSLYFAEFLVNLTLVGIT